LQEVGFASKVVPRREGQAFDRAKDKKTCWPPDKVLHILADERELCNTLLNSKPTNWITIELPPSQIPTKSSLILSNCLQIVKKLDARTLVNY